MNRFRRATSSAGFSLVEILITVAISAIMLGATLMVVFSVTRGDQALRMRSEMQLDATRALKQMTELLRQSGPIDTNDNWLSTGNGEMASTEFPVIRDESQNDGGLTFPYSFATNDDMVRIANKVTITTGLGPTWKRLDDPTGKGIKVADTYVNGKGTSYEIIFRVATDEAGDADALPIEGSTGTIQWGNSYHALVVVPVYATGTPNLDRSYAVNELQHWVFNQTTGQTTKRTLASGVERLLFETVTRTENDPPPYPLGSGAVVTQTQRQAAWPAHPGTGNQYMIRITLCMSRLGPDGNLITVWQQANVTMRCVNRT